MNPKTTEMTRLSSVAGCSAMAAYILSDAVLHISKAGPRSAIGRAPDS